MIIDLDCRFERGKRAVVSVAAPSIPAPADSVAPPPSIPAGSQQSDNIVECSVDFNDIILVSQQTHSIAYKGNIIGEQTIKSGVTILQFPSQKDAEKHYGHLNRGVVSQSVTFRPILHFHENGILSYHVWVGHNQGVPLGEFINNSTVEFWEYEKVTGIYMRASSLFRKLGKLLASLMYRLHKEDLFIGGNFLTHIFVNGDGNQTPFTLTVMGFQGHQVFKSSKFVDGVWNDLDALKFFVKYVEDTKKMQKCAANNAQKHEYLYDLKMFYGLFPAHDDRLQNKKQILDLSYIVCHTTLFWNFEERLCFCRCYEHARVSNKIHYNSPQNAMHFTKYSEMEDRENTVVTDGRLIKVYNNNHKLHRTEGYGVIPFHRVVQVHHAKDSRISRSNVNAIDADNILVELFPYALPNAYFELCKEMNNAVEFFSAGGLDYSRF